MPPPQYKPSSSSPSLLLHLLSLFLLFLSTRALECDGSGGLLVGLVVMLTPEGPGADASLQRICAYRFPSFASFLEAKLLNYYFISFTVRGACIPVSSLDNASAVSAARDGAALTAALRQTTGSTEPLPKAELVPYLLPSYAWCHIASTPFKRDDYSFPFRGNASSDYLFAVTSNYSVDSLKNRACIRSTSMKFNQSAARVWYGEEGKSRESEGTVRTGNFSVIGAEGKAGPGKALSEVEIRELTGKWCPDLVVNAVHKPVNPKAPKPSGGNGNGVLAIVLWSLVGAVVGVTVVVIGVLCWKKKKRKDESMDSPKEDEYK